MGTTVITKQKRQVLAAKNDRGTLANLSDFSNTPCSERERERDNFFELSDTEGARDLKICFEKGEKFLSNEGG